VSWTLKGIVHQKIQILSIFIHPQIVPNLYEFLSSAEHKEDILKNVCKQTALTSIVWGKKNTMEVNGVHQVYLLFCSAEEG